MSCIFWEARGFEHGSLSKRFQLSAMVGHRKGGVAGGIPPHKGGPKARPHRTAVVGGQWSVVRNEGAYDAVGGELA